MTRALALLLLLSLAACRSPGGMPADPDDEARVAAEEAERAQKPLAFVVEVDQEGPWRRLASTGTDEVSVTRHALSKPPQGRAAPSPAAARPTLPVPRRRVTAAPAPSGTRPTISPEQRARERYLANPTLVRAARITFYCPAAYLAEVRMDGASVQEPRPGRKVATGDARLTCRELTLEAAKITLRVQPAGTQDVQLTAKGNVAYVTDQRGQVFQGEGLNLLLVTNEQITPLR